MLSQENLLKDGKLHLFLLGSGGPINNQKRVTSSIAVIAGGEFILFDVGPGTYRNADLLRLPVAHLSNIFLTHFHSDHIGDLGEVNIMSWATGRSKPLQVYGPKGVDKVVNGFKMAYEFDTGYRIAHHGEEVVPPKAGVPLINTITIQDRNERELCFDRGGLQIYAFEVDHSPVNPAVGYRIEYKGLIVVITGDTIKTENIVKHCSNADILFCEAISFDLLNNMIAAVEKLNPRAAKILTDIQNYHMAPVSAAKLAKEAQVKKLVFVHITPPLLNENLEKIYLKGVSDVFNGEVVLGEDRLKFTLNPFFL
ncbi:MAG: MBL fold metallo-hydrolase [Promethearchaeota archaeon]|jgi:ribonuclease Z